MTQILLDAELRKKLNECKESIQLVDESGMIVARLIPAITNTPAVPPRPYEPPTWTPEEYQQILEGPYDTTEELLDHLEKL